MANKDDTERKLLREIHDLKLKINNQESTIKMINKWIESDIKFGRDTTLNQNKLKYAQAELARLQKELLHLSKK